MKNKNHKFHELHDYIARRNSCFATALAIMCGFFIQSYEPNKCKITYCLNIYTKDLILKLIPDEYFTALM